MHLVTNRSEKFFLANFGATIRQLRISDRISRVRFGKIIGLSVHKIDQLEDGKLDVDLELLLSITRALSLTPSTFFRIEENSRYD
jgi:DNA-binding XRE family transcriptional regulator